MRACPVYVSVCLGVLLGRLRFSALCVVQCSSVIGLPLAIAAVVGYTHWHKLHAVARNQTKFGVIYAKYEARFFYYEVTLVLRRTIFVLIATLMQQNTREQILASTLMLTFIWVAHVKCQPYIEDRLDTLDNVLLCCLLVLAICSTVFATNQMENHLEAGIIDTKFSSKSAATIAEYLCMAMLAIMFFACVLSCAEEIFCRLSWARAMFAREYKFEGTDGRAECRVSRYKKWRKLVSSFLYGYAQSEKDNAHSEKGEQLDAKESNRNALMVGQSAVSMAELHRASQKSAKVRKLSSRGTIMELSLFESFHPSFVLNWRHKLHLVEAQTMYDRLSETLGPFLCDDSSVSFLSHSLEAKFFRRLFDAFPELLDILSSDLTEQESDLAHLKAGMVAFLVLWINITQDGPKTRICDSVRKSDGPACLYFLCMEASKEDQKLFTKMMRTMVPDYVCSLPSKDVSLVGRERIHKLDEQYGGSIASSIRLLASVDHARDRKIAGLRSEHGKRIGLDAVGWEADGWEADASEASDHVRATDTSILHGREREMDARPVHTKLAEEAHEKDIVDVGETEAAHVLSFGRGWI